MRGARIKASQIDVRRAPGLGVLPRSLSFRIDERRRRKSRDYWSIAFEAINLCMSHTEKSLILAVLRINKHGYASTFRESL